MSKTVVSTFENERRAARLLDAVIANGFDSRLFSVINPQAARASSLESLIPNVPGTQARLYQRHLKMGDSLLVARVREDDVPRLIRILQSTGAHQIEAFDQ